MNNLIIEQLKTYLYILQLSEYSISAFFKWLVKTKDKKLVQKKQHLVWTAKARIIFVCALLLLSGGLLILTIYFFINYVWYLALIYTLITSIIWRVCFIFFLIIPTILLKPFEKIYIYFYLNKAKKKLIKYKENITVIGITGSYGKTSVKEFLSSILKEKYNLLVTPENINTPIGIARLINNKLNKYHEVFVVEMGAYRRGDIKKICNLVNPNIGILTGINESHLEKFKTIENTIKTKFELIESLPKSGFALINGDNKHCTNNYKKYIKCESKLYSLKSSVSEDVASGGINENLIITKLNNYQQLETGIKFGIIINKQEYDLEVNLLGKHNIQNMLPAVLVAQKLGLTNEEIKRGVRQIKPIEHRLQPTLTKNNIVIVDDAYNGNPDGAIAAIKVLSDYRNRRKIYATPGLVEMGGSKEGVHIEIGKQLAGVADMVLLISNSNTEFIAKGLKEKNYSDNKIKIYQSSQKLNEDLKNILRSGDVILFQNDWPDVYL